MDFKEKAERVQEAAYAADCIAILIGQHLEAVAENNGTIDNYLLGGLGAGIKHLMSEIDAISDSIIRHFEEVEDGAAIRRTFFAL